MAVLSAKSTQISRHLQVSQESLFIEINDEAYKQNTVYRPWREILAGITNAVSDTPARKSKVRAIAG